MSAPIQPGTVTSESPFKVRMAGDAVGQSCQRIAPGRVGQKGGVLILGGQRVWLGQYNASDVDLGPLITRIADLETAAVPHKTGKRRVLLGPEGDFEPAYELERTRPDYAAKGYMYLAANGSTTEFAIAVQDDNVTQATMRLTKNGIAYQDNIGSNGTRWVAYQNDLAAAVARIAALEAQLPQRGVPQLTIPANAATTGFVSVRFPRAFTGTPAVVASSSITSGAMNQVEVYVSAVSTTGFQLRVTTATTATTATAAPVQWIAAIN